jgi:hypothetical protein
MIGRLRFATTTQVLAMSVAWMAICFGIDFTFNRQLWAKTVTAPPGSVPLSIHFHHLRCTGCTDEITNALRTLPWLQNATVTVRTSGEDTAPGNFAGWLDVAVPDVAQIDFIPLDQTLRQAGYVPSQIDFGGPQHFRLEGRARHLCSPSTKADCEPLPDVGTVRVGNRLKWLDSMTTDATGSTVIFHVRYQKPTDRIDVKELFAAMDEYGMYPYSLHIVTSPE